ncbi:putative 9,11-endoperoxide prostaglandin H2 reductase [Nannochloris sp. 'desiccata']|nr:hypothetical protein KSW81_004629 [Chlorella desiccata (nom. nud.)]KAH7618419.1 putative 9,11-endoperoxide prostaglandin H2 reductase [Chlorella desiccata (nom. nud.)]
MAVFCAIVGSAEDCSRWQSTIEVASTKGLRVNETGDEIVMAPAYSKAVKLPSGALLPLVGLGVYKTAPGAETFQTVLSALRGGYRHIDTAQFYHNESDVGKAVLESKIAREEVFITSKVWLNNYGYDTTVASVKESLTKLQTKYIDLMLLHAPGDPKLRPESWRALEDCCRQGLVKDIGVSNFSEKHLEKLAETSTISPAVNQLEVHPFLQRKELIHYCKDHNIVVEAYSPLAKAQKLTDHTVNQIAYRVGATAAQVLIAWSLAKGLVPLPKSVNPERQHQNLQAAEVVLSVDEMRQLDELDEGLVTGWDPVTQDPV